MSFPIEACSTHPFVPEPENCMHCSILFTIQDRGTDFITPAASIHHFSEPMAGPPSQYPLVEFQESEMTLVAPMAFMYSDPEEAARLIPPYPQVSFAPIPNLIQPMPVRNWGTAITTRTYYPLALKDPQDDYYPERFALTPDEIMPVDAGPHYSDFYALGEDDIALSNDEVDVESPYRPTPPGQGKKKMRRKRAADEMLMDAKDTRARRMAKGSSRLPVAEPVTRWVRDDSEYGGSSSDCIVVEVPWSHERKIEVVRTAHSPVSRRRRSKRPKANQTEN